MAAVRQHGQECTMVEIAAVCGVSKPALAAEFGDKAGLADAMALVMADRIEAAVVTKAFTTDAGDLQRAVAAFVEAVVSYLESEPEIYRFIVRSALQGGGGTLDTALSRAFRDRVLFYFASSMPGVEPAELDVMAQGLFGFLVASTEAWHASRSPSWERLVQDITEVSVAGVSALLARGERGH
jgi:AcrR family transcriptional regulator